MNELFDTYASREGGVFWLKTVLTPKSILDAGKRGFSGAEFEFPTCPAFSRGVAEAARNGLFGFTLPGDAYRQHVCWWMAHVRGFAIDPAWIVTTQGTIFTLATLIRMLTTPEEGIIIMPPCYNRYEQAATRLGRPTTAVPLLKQEGRYQIDLPGLEKAMADRKNRILALTNPNNPTGTIFPEETLKAVMDLADRYDVTVFCDEIFAEITLQGKRVPSLCEVSRSKHAVTVTGMGKVFSLTGVNHANVIIPDEAFRERFIAQRNADHYGSLDPMVHAGLLSAFTEEGAAWVRELNAYIRRNAEAVCRTLKEIWPGIDADVPEGTFVLWVDYTNTGLEKPALEKLLDKACFLGDWGEEYYGNPLAMRYSLALPYQEIQDTMAQLKQAAREMA
ncbi:MAG: aminotransferase class I/II-fold pyridoxal phosphate-dependent enzyme [Clostridia bacterium]|nr:aminotransferase class I/II-fold pyridoxal phosphate-dependent enzyme [Clostridia bacterium]